MARNNDHSYGSGSDAGNPKCEKCGHNGQVHRETGSGKVKSRLIPLISKKVVLDGWACYNCGSYWDC